MIHEPGFTFLRADDPGKSLLLYSFDMFSTWLDLVSIGFTLPLDVG
jgi:hypothetical protein